MPTIACSARKFGAALLEGMSARQAIKTKFTPNEVLALLGAGLQELWAFPNKVLWRLAEVARSSNLTKNCMRGDSLRRGFLLVVLVVVLPSVVAVGGRKLGLGRELAVLHVCSEELEKPVNVDGTRHKAVDGVVLHLVFLVPLGPQVERKSCEQYGAQDARIVLRFHPETLE